MDYYNKGGEPHPHLDSGVVPLGLGKDEIDALGAVMFTLTDERFSDQNRKDYGETAQARGTIAVFAIQI